MKLSDLHPCDGCGGPLIDPETRVGNFYVLRSSSVLPKPSAGRSVMGLHTLFGGGPEWSPSAVALAETFAPDPHVFIVVGDHEPELLTEALVCFDCYTSKSIHEIVERANREKAAREEAGAGRRPLT